MKATVVYTRQCMHKYRISIGNMYIDSFNNTIIILYRIITISRYNLKEEGTAFMQDHWYSIAFNMK